MHTLVDPFYIIGIAIRTTNENGQSAQDIPALWGRFMNESIAEKIPSKISQDLYCIYNNYEKDHTRPYTTLLGCKVSSLEAIPEGMIGETISGGIYTKRAAHGNIQEGSVFNEWVKIWNSDLPRVFTADFEVYGEKAWDPQNAEVEIFVAIQP